MKNEKIKFCAISDTHCQHDRVKVPECDVLLHAGDFSSMGRPQEVLDFMKWFDKQPAEHKIFISGNHDFLDEEHPAIFKQLLNEYPGITYLRDEGTEVFGIKIWGRPWTPEFYDWAFMADRGSPKMKSTLNVIPSDTDILLTHGPAYEILDKTMQGLTVGCQDMLEELNSGRFTNLKYVIVGHIHESVGSKEVNGIKHLNVAVLNERYVYKNKPFEFEIDITKKTK